MTIFRRIGISLGVFKVGVALAAFTLLGNGIALADTIAYVSDTIGLNLTAWDVTTNTIAVLTPSAVSGSAGAIDSLEFVTGSGVVPSEIVYSIIGGNRIGAYTCSSFATNGTCNGASTNTVLSSSSLFNAPSDIAVDPGGATFLVSNSMNNTVDRVNVTTGTATLFKDFGMRPDGLAYDAAGDLFVVLNENEVAQINSTTGAIIKTISTPNQADGLTYDSTNNTLYVGSDGGGFYTVNTSLTSATFTGLTLPPGSEIDGVAAAGNLLYLIERDIAGLQYNLTTGTLTEISPNIAGADDIAAQGGNSLNPTPEPGTSVLIGAGLMLIGLARVAGRRRARQD